MPRELFEAVRTGRRDALRAEIAAAWPVAPARLVLEIGCGNGHFLTAYAAAHPDQTCAGLDLRLERIVKARRKRDRAGLDRLHFFRCDALDFLAELPADVRLADIFMLFPDPWPKKRHHKHRLLKPALLDTLAARAGQGSRFFFRTDFKPYYDEAAGIVAAHTAWALLPPGPFPFEHPTIFQARAVTFHSLGAARQPGKSVQMQ
ncbi:MAG TPA: methyltransferase domain-containing protein [Opitutaceae bacterium]|nr:methyltransferase domain-containing protein [Opitutaceae bacterium]